MLMYHRAYLTLVAPRPMQSPVIQNSHQTKMPRASQACRNAGRVALQPPHRRIMFRPISACMATCTCTPPWPDSAAWLTCIDGAQPLQGCICGAGSGMLSFGFAIWMRMSSWREQCLSASLFAQPVGLAAPISAVMYASRCHL